MKKGKDRWDSFEPYTGPPLRELPAWLNTLCKWIFVLIGLGIVFAICGGLLFLLPYRSRGVLGDLVANEGPLSAGLRFGAGGIFGVATLLWWMKFGRR